MTKAGFTGLAAALAALACCSPAAARQVTVGDGEVAGGAFELSAEKRRADAPPGLPDRLRPPGQLEICLTARFRTRGSETSARQCEPNRARPLVGPPGVLSSCDPRVTLISGLASDRVRRVEVRFSGRRPIEAELFPLPRSFRSGAVAYMAAARTGRLVASVRGYDRRGRRVSLRRVGDEIEEFVEGPRCERGGKERIVRRLPLLAEGPSPAGGTYEYRGGSVRLRSGRRIVCAALRVTGAGERDPAEVGLNCRLRRRPRRLVTLAGLVECGPPGQTFVQGVVAPGTERVALDYHDGRRVEGRLLGQAGRADRLFLVLAQEDALPNGITTFDSSGRARAFERVALRPSDPCGDSERGSFFAF